MVDTHEMASLYSEKLKSLSAEVESPARLENPDTTAMCMSPICGSEVTIDLNLDKDRKITDFGYAVEACALTKSVVAILNRHVRGKTCDEIEAVGRALEAMLKENGAVPAGEWAEFDVLVPVREYKARHNTILLPFQAIQKAFEGVA